MELPVAGLGVVDKGVDVESVVPEQGKGDQYGYFWWPIAERGTTGYAARGSWDQHIFVISSGRLVIVT